MLHKKPVVWTDNNISPAVSKWLNEQFDVEAQFFYTLNFQTTNDYDIFMKAKEQNVILVTKDSDFKILLKQHKAPPFIILLRKGNTSNADLKILLQDKFQKGLDLILKHDHKIEIE